jgi:hypothetical protein
MDKSSAGNGVDVILLRIVFNRAKSVVFCSKSCNIGLLTKQRRNKMAKVTLTTLKSFIKKNEGKLYINVKSTFDGSCDSVMPRGGGFKPTQPSDMSNSLGVKGVWVVGSSRNYLSTYQSENFTGIEVDNCCGSFIVAIKNAA